MKLLRRLADVSLYELVYPQNHYRDQCICQVRDSPFHRVCNFLVQMGFFKEIYQYQPTLPRDQLDNFCSEGRCVNIFGFNYLISVLLLLFHIYSKELNAFIYLLFAYSSNFNYEINFNKQTINFSIVSTSTRVEWGRVPG